jgi:hypothetical protein
MVQKPAVKNPGKKLRGLGFTSEPNRHKSVALAANKTEQKGGTAKDRRKPTKSVLLEPPSHLSTQPLRFLSASSHGPLFFNKHTLGPDDIKSFDGLVQGKVQKLRFTLKNKGSSKRRRQGLTRLVAVTALPPAIRDCAEVQRLLHQE